MDAKACELKEQNVKACTYPDARKCDQVEHGKRDVLSTE